MKFFAVCGFFLFSSHLVTALLTTSCPAVTTIRKGYCGQVNNIMISHDAPSKTTLEPNAKSHYASTTTSTTTTTTQLGALPAALAAVPAAPEIVISLLSTCLGYIKSEWTVANAYGIAVALNAWSLLQRFPNTLFPGQGYALIFYGIRLNVFLFVRTLTSKRMQEFQESIEERAKAKGSRLSRTPFIISCAMLYYGLTVPLWFTSQLGPGAAAAAGVPTFVMDKLLPILVKVQWFGFGLAALGDFTKTYVKRSEKDDNFLVTSGIFRWIRHPNYTGEMIGWTANSVMGVIAASLLLQTQKITATRIANLAVQTLGWVGILLVLLGASSNLEARQSKDYGTSEKYRTWISKSWGGWMLPTKEDNAPLEHETPELVLNDEIDEDMGSGI